MRSLPVAVMAALLLGLVVGMPVRASALEGEGAISTQRAQGILEEASTTSILWGFVAGVATLFSGFAPGALCMAFGLLLTMTCLFSPIGLPLLIIGLMLSSCGFMCALPAGIVTYFITLPQGIILSIESFPARLVNWIVWNLRRLCVPF